MKVKHTKDFLGNYGTVLFDLSDVDRILVDGKRVNMIAYDSNNKEIKPEVIDDYDSNNKEIEPEVIDDYDSNNKEIETKKIEKLLNILEAGDYDEGIENTNFDVEDLIKLSNKNLQEENIDFLEEIFWDWYPHEISLSETPKDVKDALSKIGKILVQNARLSHQEYKRLI